MTPNDQAIEAAAAKVLMSNTFNYSWDSLSDAPLATFDIMEDDELFCRGIVFSLGTPENKP
jgi:hypothetical protein